jgi:hypothetical protein
MTRPPSKLSSVLGNLGFGYPQLVGLPIAGAFELEKVIKKVIKRYFPGAIFAVRARRLRRYFRDALLAR